MLGSRTVEGRPVKDVADTGRRAPDLDLSALYAQTRARTEAFASRLSPEDQLLQSMPDASPTKWHRAHTTWFFETFVLAPAGIARVDARYDYLFNSYYEAVGPRHARARRGMLSRPTAVEIGDYRRKVDERMIALARHRDRRGQARACFRSSSSGSPTKSSTRSCSSPTSCTPSPRTRCAPPSWTGRRPPPAPCRPRPPRSVRRASCPSTEVCARSAHPRRARSSSTTSTPRHGEWVEPFALSDRLVTFGELEAFVQAGGYRTPSLWLAEGYDFVRAHDLSAPLYVSFDDGVLQTFSLTGVRRPARDEPLVHVSYYEADAISRFLGARLPTEGEWEIAAAQAPVAGNFVDDEVLHPLAATATPGGAGRPPSASSSATRGSGRDRATSRIPATVRRRARWASTTASSW